MTDNFQQNINTPSRGRAVIAAVTLTQSDVGKVIMATAGAYEVTLPLASEAGVGGWVWVVAPAAAGGNITVGVQAGDTLDDAADVTNPLATTPSALYCVSDGVLDWVTVGGAD